MNRFLSWALLALALCSLTASYSHAGVWVQEQVLWSRTGTTVDGAVVSRPVKFPVTTAAQAKVDTTDSFSLDLADFPPMPTTGKVSATALDTTVFAKLIFYGDSTTASTIVFDATTFALQANSGENSTGWQTVYTYSSLNTSGQKYVEVPIWSNRAATITRDLYIDRTGDLSLFGNQWRVIVTWNGASVAVPFAKCKLVYYKKVL